MEIRLNSAKLHAMEVRSITTISRSSNNPENKWNKIPQPEFKISRKNWWMTTAA
jgi:hypothetical protein